MTKPKPKRSTQGKGRFSARKKAEAVRRLVAGEDLDVLARELGSPPQRSPPGATSFLRPVKPPSRVARVTADDEVLRLKAMVGELTMRNEILQEGIRIKEGRPLLTRRSRP